MDDEYLTEQKPRRRWSPLWVQTMAGLSWPFQELLQTSRPSTRTSASISPGGGSSKLDTEPQPATWHLVSALGGLAPLCGSLSSPTAGPKMAELFSYGENTEFWTTQTVTTAPASVYPSVTPGLLALWRESNGCQKATAFATACPLSISPYLLSPNGLSKQHLLPCSKPSHCPWNKTLTPHQVLPSSKNEFTAMSWAHSHTLAHTVPPTWSIFPIQLSDLSLDTTFSRKFPRCPG